MTPPAGPRRMERLSTADFSGDRLAAALDTAVCFYAGWCPFCVDFLPRFAALEGTVPFRLALADISDESTPLWETFGIAIVPTLVAFRAGRIFWRKDGVGGYGLDDHDLAALQRAFITPSPPPK
ncbi:MAG: thioredoxin family protein [Thermoplasmata archaeon]|nr:thioredoxin family protein [Thermoplasmata archaeon]